MDWLTFISNIINSIIWPVTIIILIIIFKEKIKELVPYVKKLKYKDLEMNFERQITDIERHAEQAELPEMNEAFDNNINYINSEIISRLNNIKETNIYSSRSAIIESWMLVEQLLRNLSESYNLNNLNKPSSIILKELFDKQIISNDLFEICNQLRIIRNDAVHNVTFNVNAQKANEYINLSFRVVAYLKDKLKQ